jgi:hypothetical protein
VIRLDKTKFEKRGGFGCSNSGYGLRETTCCRKPVAGDVELDDIYFDPVDLSKAVVRVWEQNERPCALCGASDWNIKELEPPEEVPAEWSWAEQ